MPLGRRSCGTMAAMHDAWGEVERLEGEVVALVRDGVCDPAEVLRVLEERGERGSLVRAAFTFLWAAGRVELDGRMQFRWPS